MSLSSEEETFVEELARRAKTQNASPAYLIQTKAGKVSMSPEETKHLDPICAVKAKLDRRIPIARLSVARLKMHAL